MVKFEYITLSFVFNLSCLFLVPLFLFYFLTSCGLTVLFMISLLSLFWGYQLKLFVLLFQWLLYSLSDTFLTQQVILYNFMYLNDIVPLHIQNESFTIVFCNFSPLSNIVPPLSHIQFNTIHTELLLFFSQLCFKVI